MLFHPRIEIIVGCFMPKHVLRMGWRFPKYELAAILAVVGVIWSSGIFSTKPSAKSKSRAIAKSLEIAKPKVKPTPREAFKPKPKPIALAKKNLISVRASVASLDSIAKLDASLDSIAKPMPNVVSDLVAIANLSTLSRLDALPKPLVASKAVPLPKAVTVIKQESVEKRDVAHEDIERKVPSIKAIVSSPGRAKVGKILGSWRLDSVSNVRILLNDSLVSKAVAPHYMLMPGSEILQPLTGKNSFPANGEEGFFTVRLGVFVAKESVKKVYSEMRSLGLEPFTKKKVKGGVLRYYVYIGRFNDRLEADSFHESLREKTQLQSKVTYHVNFYEKN
jgi:hypothetical protein